MKNRWFALAIVGGKTPQNLGAILRLAVNFGAASVYLVGHRYYRLPEDTPNAAGNLPVVECEDLPRLVGATHVYIEKVDHAVPLPKFEHPRRALYIVGPEDGSLVVPSRKKAVVIPTFGSLNQAQSVLAVLYDRVAKSDFIAG
jgi:tRNA(Leu) C34 or U34 (ribose-2'-O)-methylase TrmL